MISASSGDLSKTDQMGGASPTTYGSKPYGSKKFWVITALALLIAFILMAGPSILLNLLLKNMFSADTGLSLHYDRARAGFLFNSASVEGVRLESRYGDMPLPLVRIDSILLDGASLKGILALNSALEKMPSGPLFLARSVSIRNAAFNSGLIQAELAEAKTRNLILDLKDPASNPPVLFDLLELKGLKYTAGDSLHNQIFELNQLEARHLDGDKLGSIKLTLLSFEYENREEAEKSADFSLDGLTAGGLKLAAMKQAAKGPGGSVPWWLLAGCDTLDLVRAELRLNRKEALNIESAVFDYHPAAGDTVDYTRRIDFKVNTANLAALNRQQPWLDLNDVSGGSLQGRLDFQLNYASPRGLSNLKTACLDLRDLGRIELSGLLYGVPETKPHYSPYQIIFDINTAWRLDKMTLSFEDRGIAKNFYRYLNRTAFAGKPGGIESKIMNFTINPIHAVLREEGGIANLAALYNEVEAFVRRPSYLRLTSEPEKPYTILSLANLDKYDIIDKLRLTVEVDERAPVFVAIGSEPETVLPPPAPLAYDQGLDIPFGAEQSE